ncbi:hypothetical protein [Dyella koreensis]|uniref:Zinc ribbon domain-containing protein n=1 Tax=Dyella koreensis TaxID=311235 RepID=A0ABW8JZ98_9GAMM
MLMEQTPLIVLRAYLLGRYRQGLWFVFLVGPLCWAMAAGLFVGFPQGLSVARQPVPNWVPAVVAGLLIGVGYVKFFSTGLQFLRARGLLHAAETRPQGIVLIYREATTISQGAFMPSVDKEERIVLADDQGKTYTIPGGYKDDTAFWNAATAVFAKAHRGATHYIVELYRRDALGVPRRDPAAGSEPPPVIPPRGPASMIYVYSIVTKPLASDRLPHESCPACGKQGGVEVTLYTRYISMIAPIFGMGLRTGVECTLCGHQIKHPQAGMLARAKWSPAVAEAIKSIRANTRRTIWQRLYPWTLSIVFGGLVAGALIAKPFLQASRDQVTASNKALLAHPQAGDIYKVNLMAMAPEGQGAGKVALVKVVRITGNAMVLVRGKQMLPFGFNDSDWTNVSRKDDAFDSQEYKADLDKFLHGREPGQFHVYNDGAAAEISKHQELLGEVMGDNYGRLHVAERP